MNEVIQYLCYQLLTRERAKSAQIKLMYVIEL